jgi:hypothetical protein
MQKLKGMGLKQLAPNIISSHVTEYRIAQLPSMLAAPCVHPPLSSLCSHAFGIQKKAAFTMPTCWLKPMISTLIRGSFVEQPT